MRNGARTDHELGEGDEEELELADGGLSGAVAGEGVADGRISREHHVGSSHAWGACNTMLWRPMSTLSREASSPYTASSKKPHLQFLCLISGCRVGKQEQRDECGLARCLSKQDRKELDVEMGKAERRGGAEEQRSKEEKLGSCLCGPRQREE